MKRMHFYFGIHVFPLHTSCKRDPNMTTVDESWVGWAPGKKRSRFFEDFEAVENWVSPNTQPLRYRHVSQALASGGLNQSENGSWMKMLSLNALVENQKC